MPSLLSSPPLLHMIVLAVLAHLVLSGMRITTSLYALSLHASPLVVGSLVSVLALLPVFLAVSAGRWQDKVGLARPLQVGGLCLLLGCGLLLFLKSLAALYIAAGLVGVGFMLVHIASQNMVGVLSSAETRAANFSWLALGFSTSGFCAPVIAGFVIDHFGHHISYLLFAGIALLAMLMIWHGKMILPMARKPAPAEHASANSVLDLFWHNKDMREIYLIGITLASAWEMFAFVIPIQGTQQGLSASTIGLILGCFAAATFVVRLAMPYIARHWREWQILRLVLSITCLSFLILPWLNQAWSMMLLAFVLGLGLGGSQPNMLNLLHQAAPPERAAEAIGIRVTIGNASQVVLPLTFGVLGTSLGLLPVFVGMSAMVAIGLPTVWRRARA